MINTINQMFGTDFEMKKIEKIKGLPVYMLSQRSIYEVSDKRQICLLHIGLKILPELSGMHLLGIGFLLWRMINRCTFHFWGLQYTIRSGKRKKLKLKK